MLTLCVTADDFGQDASVNEAVRLAHEQGVLCAASLMVTGEAWREAVEIARRMPALQVGLHVVLSDGRAVLPAGEIPHLVDGAGRFHQSPAQAGWRYWWDPRARAELRREITAQFERFAATGLPLSHVDGHQHLHMHPVVFDCVAGLAERYGARRIRVVHDDLALALRFDSRARTAKRVMSGIFRALERHARRRLRQTRLQALEKTYGFFMSGRMTPAYVDAVVRQPQTGSAEIYFHPRAGERTAEQGANPGDLACLLSPEVRELLGRHMAGAAAPIAVHT